MSAICRINVDRTRPGRFAGVACGMPAMVRVEFGCVHEHINAEDVCGQHAERVSAATGDLVCTKCWEAGHKCPVTGRVAVPGGAR